MPDQNNAASPKLTLIESRCDFRVQETTAANSFLCRRAEERNKTKVFVFFSDFVPDISV